VRCPDAVTADKRSPPRPRAASGLTRNRPERPRWLRRGGESWRSRRYRRCRVVRARNSSLDPRGTPATVSACGRRECRELGGDGMPSMACVRMKARAGPGVTRREVESLSGGGTIALPSGDVAARQNLPSSDPVATARARCNVPDVGASVRPRGDGASAVGQDVATLTRHEGWRLGGGDSSPPQDSGFRGRSRA